MVKKSNDTVPNKKVERASAPQKSGKPRAKNATQKRVRQVTKSGVHPLVSDTSKTPANNLYLAEQNTKYLENIADSLKSIALTLDSFRQQASSRGSVEAAFEQVADDLLVGRASGGTDVCYRRLSDGTWMKFRRYAGGGLGQGEAIQGSPPPGFQTCG